MLLGDAPKNETEVGSGSIEELMTLDVVLVIILLLLEAVAWQWGLEIQMSFHAGWDRQQSLQDSLTQHLTRDRERGSTGVGPHRADLSLRYQGKMAKEVLSRGQQKLTAVALALAQLEFLKDTVGLLPTVLLDDPSAELDQAHLERFLGRIQSLRTQLIVTALERNFGWFGAPESVFHVERGQVFRV